MRRIILPDALPGQSKTNEGGLQSYAHPHLDPLPQGEESSLAWSQFGFPPSPSGEGWDEGLKFYAVLTLILSRRERKLIQNPLNCLRPPFPPFSPVHLVVERQILPAAGRGRR
jgi:hypothetical protein